MTEVLHQLVTRRAAISAEVVGMLEDYLAQARRGEIVEVALVGIMPDGAIISTASRSEKQVVLIGGVARLMHRMQLNADGDEHEL